LRDSALRFESLQVRNHFSTHRIYVCVARRFRAFCGGGHVTAAATAANSTWTAIHLDLENISWETRKKDKNKEAHRLLRFDVRFRSW